MWPKLLALLLHHHQIHSLCPFVATLSFRLSGPVAGCPGDRPLPQPEPHALCSLPSPTLFRLLLALQAPAFGMPGICPLLLLGLPCPLSRCVTVLQAQLHSTSRPLCPWVWMQTLGGPVQTHSCSRLAPWKPALVQPRPCPRFISFPLAAAPEGCPREALRNSFVEPLSPWARKWPPPFSQTVTTDEGTEQKLVGVMGRGERGI